MWKRQKGESDPGFIAESGRTTNHTDDCPTKRKATGGRTCCVIAIQAGGPVGKAPRKKHPVIVLKTRAKEEQPSENTLPGRAKFAI